MRVSRDKTRLRSEKRNVRVGVLVGGFLGALFWIAAVSEGTLAQTKGEKSGSGSTSRVDQLVRIAANAAKKGDLEGAYNGYRRAIKLAPDRPQLYRAIGDVLGKRGKLEAQVCSYRIAADLDPTNSVHRTFQAAALERLGRMTEAEKAYRLAIQVDPSFVHAHFGLAMLLLKRNDSDRAEAEFKTALQIDPSFAEAHAGLGQVYDQRGQKDPALREYLEYLRLHKGDPSKKAWVRDRVNALQLR